MNALFALNKPIGISSNGFLMRLKKQYGWKKCGYSGTLDPFASGLLVVGVGTYTRLFPYLDKNIKTYEATLWLGARSESLDLEEVSNIQEIPEYPLEQILNVLESLKGEITYTPPRFSAKHVGGKRAYQLARSGVSFKLEESRMRVFDLELLSYVHPFLSFRASVSEGGYIRSLGEMIALRLGRDGSLSQLRRIQEGRIKVPKTIEKIEALEALSLEKLDLEPYENDLYLGRKIRLCGQEEGQCYLAVFEKFFSIIDVSENQEVRYRLNRMPRC